MVFLFHLDGKLPNLALMRLSSHLKQQGREVVFRPGGQPERTLWECDRPPKEIYASAIFESTRPVIDRLKRVYPSAIIGGTGYCVESNLVPDGELDYSLYNAG